MDGRDRIYLKHILEAIDKIKNTLWVKIIRNL